MMKKFSKIYILSMMKHTRRMNFSILFCLLMASGLYVPLSAQQQQLHTMFMYNKLLINPAYAGYHDHVCVSGIVREQWLGFQGAPKAQAISLNAPLSSQRIGLGLNLQRQSIGVSSATTVDGIYSYRIPMGKGFLSLGVQASGRFLEVDYS